MPEGSQQYVICVPRLVEENYHGYKHLSDDGRKDFAHKHVIERLKLKIRSNIINVIKN